MDTEKISELSALSTQQIKNAERYSEARIFAGEAESHLKILLTAKLPELRGNKKNLGIEMAILMLMEDSEVARKLYLDWVKWESVYKGLEKLIDAYSSKLIFEQSLMKFRKEGERWG